MKSYYIHLKNKYPKAHVQYSENAIDVFQDGEHLVSMIMNGAGQFVCRSKEMGCRDVFCLSPIPKDSRIYKLTKDGSFGMDESAVDRKKAREEFMDSKGKVMSCEELADRYEFDDKQRVHKKKEVKAVSSTANKLPA